MTRATLLSPVERVYADMELAPNGECWLFTGTKNKQGYGRIAIGGRRGCKKYTHRIVYEYANGPIPSGMVVCHRCDTPSCVRPTHLFLGTTGDNARDMWTKGRGRVFSRRTHCKHGHEFSAENTRWCGAGYQCCRECSNAPRRKGTGPTQPYRPRVRRGA